MRAAFGLVGLLVAIGVIVLMMKYFHPADTVQRGEKLKEQAAQFAGREEDGTPAHQSIKLEPVLANGRLKYVIVEDIVPGGAFERFYGLKRDDCIIGRVDMDFRNDSDAEMAVTMIHDAYQRKAPLAVLRNGQKITLPLEEKPTAGGTTASEAPAPAPGSGKSDTSNPLQRQLDAIPGIAR